MPAAVKAERSTRGLRERPRRGDVHLEPRAAGSGRPTLDDRITAIWNQLVETGTAECPV